MIESRTALRESQQASDGLPDINAITRELRESLAKTYEDWREGWFSSIFMGHEQVLEVNGEASRGSVSDDEVVSATVAPCEEQRTIKIAHFHENVSKTPIPSTRFQLEENTGRIHRAKRIGWFWRRTFPVRTWMRFTKPTRVLSSDVVRCLKTPGIMVLARSGRAI